MVTQSTLGKRVSLCLSVRTHMCSHRSTSGQEAVLGTVSRSLCSSVLSHGNSAPALFSRAFSSVFSYSVSPAFFGFGFWRASACHVPVRPQFHPLPPLYAISFWFLPSLFILFRWLDWSNRPPDRVAAGSPGSSCGLTAIKKAMCDTHGHTDCQGSRDIAGVVIWERRSFLLGQVSFSRVLVCFLISVLDISSPCPLCLQWHKYIWTLVDV